MGKITTQLAEQIVNDLYEVHSLNKVLKDHGIHPQQFYDLLTEVPLIAEKYMRAREAIGDSYADEIVEIADTETDPHKARNRIDARKWAAAKLKPTVYGDRIDLNVNQTVDLIGALKEAKERQAQVIDITTKMITTSTGLKTCDELDVENEDPSNDFAKLIE